MSDSKGASATVPAPAPVAIVDGSPCLQGGRCPSCGVHTFPRLASCPKCGAATEAATLPTEGTLWTFTVQRLQPKAPYRSADPFVPFAVGYVDLGPIRVESPLFGRRVEEWTIGESLVLRAGEPSADGVISSFSFVPKESAK